MDRSRKDPTNERGEGRGYSDIHNEEKECCADGACSWYENTTAQSNGEKSGRIEDKGV